MQGRLTSDRSLTCSITLSSLGSFYDHFGRPDFDKIESLLGDQQEVTVCGLSREAGSEAGSRSAAARQNVDAPGGVLTVLSCVLVCDWLVLISS